MLVEKMGRAAIVARRLLIAPLVQMNLAELCLRTALLASPLMLPAARGAALRGELRGGRGLGKWRLAEDLAAAIAHWSAASRGT